MRSLIDGCYLIQGLWGERSLKSGAYRRLSRWYYQLTAKAYKRKAIREGYGDPLELGLRRLAEMDFEPRLILDACTGTGYVALRLVESFPKATIIGIDLSPKMLEEARSEGTPANLLLLVGDQCNLPFEDGVFDLVTLQNAPPWLSELLRVTKAGGMLMMAFSSGGGLPRWFLGRVRARLARKCRESRIHMEISGAGLLILIEKANDPRLLAGCNGRYEQDAPP